MSWSLPVALAITMVLDEHKLQHPPGATGNAFISQAQRDGRPAQRPRNPDPRKFPRSQASLRNQPTNNSFRNQRFPNRNDGSQSKQDFKWNPRRRACVNFGKDDRCDGRHLDKDCPARAGNGCTMSSAQTVPMDAQTYNDSLMDLLEPSDNHRMKAPQIALCSPDLKTYHAQRIIRIPTHHRRRNLHWPDR